MSSKSPKKQAAKSKREVEAAARKRRNIILGSVLAVAVVVAAVIILAGSGGDKSSSGAGEGGAVQGKKEVTELFDGIPQKGAELGNPKAKVTLIEFADLQCPFCRQYSLRTLPILVNDYVRPGKVRMELRTLAFIGPDSQKAAIASAAAGKQNLEWTFSDLFYFNQGQENSGYVTPEFIDKIYKAAGVNVAQANKYAATPAAKVPLAQSQRDAEKYGVVSTPTFLIGETGGPYTKLEVDLKDVAGFKAAFDELLK